jgi:hypothetical protein
MSFSPEYIDLPLEAVRPIGKIVDRTAMEIHSDGDQGCIKHDVMARAFCEAKVWAPKLKYDGFRKMVNSSIW